MIDLARLPHRSLIVAGLILAELVVLAAAYQVAVSFECQAIDAYALCRFLRSLVARSLAVLAVAALVVWAMPAVFARFRDAAADHPAAARWAGAHATGVVLLFAPLAVLSAADQAAFFAGALWFWLPGVALAVAGGVLWLAPPAAWRRLWSDAGGMLAAALVLALLVPDLAEVALPLWDIRALTEATYVAVAIVLSVLGQTPYADPASMVLGLESFAVHIARQCSGVEGFALVLMFSAVHALLFRETLRQGRFWLLVVPVALLVSWTFNVLRIAALVLIGEYLSPELAVNGFHSYAGWLFFTVLVVTILGVVQTVPGLHRGETAPVGLPLWRDPVAARIVPFVAFMLGSIAAAAFFAPADVGYPLKVAAMAAALLAFRAALMHEAWRPDALAVVAGIAVGLAWGLTEPAPGEASAALAAALGTLPAAALAAWVALRLLGTIVLVPVVEELFFRGYVLTRLDRGGLAWRIVAVAVSTLAFAALHGRIGAAIVAGLVFAAVMLRRGRVGDAVAAHVAANAVVAGFAAASGDWTRL